MKAVFTSASANKRIRSLKEQLDSLLSAERENSTTSYCEGETPIKKEYSFLSTQVDIRQINDQIARLRHAINCFNTTAQAPGSQAGRKRCPGCVWGNKVSGVCTQPRCIKGLEEKHEGAGSL